MTDAPHAYAGPHALAVALSKPPTLQLNFYEFGVVMRRQCPDGSVTEYPVDPSQLAEALAARTHFTTGLLPPDVLYVAQSGLKRLVVGYRAPQRTALHLDGSEKPLRIPLPGLLLIRLTTGGSQPRYGVFAVKARPAALTEKLYHAPLPNVYASGSICWGSVPAATPDLLARADLSSEWALLLGSLFTPHAVGGKSTSARDDIRQLYLRLEQRGARVYPTRDLLPATQAGTLGAVIGRQMGETSA